MSNRFSRQELLPEVGASGQWKIGRARVLVIGAGGLGCPALQYLAAAGVGTIGILDGDRIEASNLARQVLYGAAHLGFGKAETAARVLGASYPDISFEVFSEFLTPENAVERVSGFDLILDGTDHLRAKAILNSAAGITGKPVVFASVTGWEGQLFLSRPGTTACFRCLFPSLRENGNCNTRGVLGPVAGMMGALQAAESLKWILGDLSREAPGVGSVFCWDARTLHGRSFRVPVRTNCPACGPGSDRFAFPEASAPICVSPRDGILIDVREAGEREEGAPSESLHLPLSGLLAGTHTPPRTAQKLLLFCRSGARAERAREHLRSLGWTNLEVLKDFF